MKKKLEIKTNHNTEDCKECNALIKMAFSFVVNNGEGKLQRRRYVNLKNDEFHSADITEL